MSIALMATACPLCSVVSSTEWVDLFGTCDQCAEKIANAFWHKHSGEWLTKPNTPSRAPKKAQISQQLRTRVFERDAYRCVFCQTHIDLCVDHIHPESKGGTLDFDNLQTLCRPCNSVKGASL